MNKDILQGNEKLVVWIANIINPLLAGFLFYYMWRKSLPNKAKQSNTVSLIVAGIEIVGYLGYELLFNKSLQNSP